jgi:hypothetical protein
MGSGNYYTKKNPQQEGKKERSMGGNKIQYTIYLHQKPLSLGLLDSTPDQLSLNLWGGILDAPFGKLLW